MRNGTATRCASTRRRARSCTTRCGRWWGCWSRSAKVDGARTMSRAHWRRATAMLVVRWRRRTGSISSGWIIEIAIKNAPVYGGERREIGRGHAFVDPVHGGVDEAEFHDRAIILDEAGVGCSPGRRKLRLTAGHLGNCTAHHIDERARLGDKDVSVRWLPRDAEMPALRRRVGARFDQRLERSLSVAIIEPNVEASARLGRNDVDGLVADVDGSEFQVGWIEMSAAGVERLRHHRHDGDDAAHRIVGE